MLSRPSSGSSAPQARQLTFQKMALQEGMSLARDGDERGPHAKFWLVMSENDIVADQIKVTKAMLASTAVVYRA